MFQPLKTYLRRRNWKWNSLQNHSIFYKNMSLPQLSFICQVCVTSFNEPRTSTFTPNPLWKERATRRWKPKEESLLLNEISRVLRELRYFPFLRAITNFAWLHRSLRPLNKNERWWCHLLGRVPLNFSVQPFWDSVMPKIGQLFARIAP